LAQNNTTWARTLIPTSQVLSLEPRFGHDFVLEFEFEVK